MRPAWGRGGATRGEGLARRVAGCTGGPRLGPTARRAGSAAVAPLQRRHLCAAHRLPCCPYAACSRGSGRSWRRTPCLRRWCGQRRPAAAAPRRPPRSCRRAARLLAEASLACLRLEQTPAVPEGARKPRGAAARHCCFRTCRFQIEFNLLRPSPPPPPCSATRTCFRRPPALSSCGRGHAASTSGRSL